MKARTPTKHEEDIYMSLVLEIKKKCDEYPEIRNVEIIGILGRVTGYCVAMCYPDERDIARATAIVNMDTAISDTASPGPSTAGNA